MRKNLLALAIFSTFSTMALAQTNVTIYGIMDCSLAKETGSDTRMRSNQDNRIGFKGTEELGNGLKATFQLEQRFNLHTGEKFSGFNAQDIVQGRDKDGKDGAEWQGAANIGLTSASLGSIRMGRVDNVGIDLIYPVDPFALHGVAAGFGVYNLIYSEQVPNTVRYDSASWKGLKFTGSYSLGNDTHGKDNKFSKIGNDGFAGGLTYDNGPIMLTATYDRLADSDKSSMWGAGGAYTFGNLKLSAGYQKTIVKSAMANAFYNIGSQIDQNNWVAGGVYTTGPHIFTLSYNWGEIKSRTQYNGQATKYAAGYVYKLSKRTRLLANVAYTDSDNNYVGEIFNSNHAMRDSVTGLQMGITHQF